MTIENLRCFALLARELNFTRAAEKAHITQTAMSRKISSIEAELSVQLFDRNHHQVLLTTAGQEFYSRIQPLLVSYDDAVAWTQNVSSGMSETVQIGVGVYEHTLLQPVIRDFVRRYPVSKLNCVQYRYRELLVEFDRDRLDLILTSDQFLHTLPQENLHKVLLHDRPWVLAMHESNPLVNQDPVRMIDLANQNVITMYEGSINTVRASFQGRFSLSTIDYVNSHETKLMLVNVNRGVGFIPSFVPVDSYSDIVTRYLDPPYRPRKYYAICKKTNTNPYAHRLADLLDKYYRPMLWMQELSEQ